MVLKTLIYERNICKEKMNNYVSLETGQYSAFAGSFFNSNDASKDSQ